MGWIGGRRRATSGSPTNPRRYPCRTSLAKRWGFPLWYNQYYSPKTKDYAHELWAAALGGGRLNVHPLYPRADVGLEEAHLALMRGRFMTGMNRLRMLDFITRAPLDCPVAIVFGAACAMNWAGPSYNQVGLEIASALCAGGYPADLIPSSLVGGPALRIDGDGYVCLGPQRYRAVVLYQPEFGDKQELAFLERSARGPSAVFLLGQWTRDPEARPLEAMARMGRSVRQYRDDGACAEAVARFLGEAGVPRVTGWSEKLQGWGQSGSVLHAAPPADGHSVMTDGTYVRIAGSKDSAGDPINETFTWGGHTVAVDAVGVFAIRFEAGGQVAALAAGGLKSLKTGRLEVAMPERADVAFIKEASGKVHGVLQGLAGDVPATLRSIAPEWQRLSVPPARAASAPGTKNPKAIAEVAAGKRTEARVGWWGFDPADSTAALQTAINSGARRLIVGDMGTPWITDKLTLTGNQQIVFEKGVVVQARRGAFRGSGDCLFSAALKTNIYARNEIGEGGWLVPCREEPDGTCLKVSRRVVFDR